MDYNKTKILKEIRELLQTLKCEIVVDINDSQLFNVLFQSDVKKETLLKWLLQQMYSLDACTNTPLDDLVSTFIPRSQLRGFLIGTMPIAEQYRKWKLIMTVLCTNQRRSNYPEEIDYQKELLTGSLPEKYSTLWSEKVASTSKYCITFQDQPKKVNESELKSELDKLKMLLAAVKSKKKSDEKATNAAGSRISTILDQYRRSSELLNEALAQNLSPNANSSTNSTEQFNFRYDAMNSDVIKNVATKVKSLQDNMETLDNVLNHVNKIQD